MSKEPHDQNFVCRFNKHIDCYEFTKCYSCAWNPDVQKIRVQKVRETMKYGK